MVKIPIGEKVEVNLWNRHQKHGMVKYYHSTMDICRAESEFELKKGDYAYVVESYDSFAVIVPEDEYTDLIDNFQSKRMDLTKLAFKIGEILKERQEETGGILSDDEIFSILRRTSIQSFISQKLIKRLSKFSDAPYDSFKFEKQRYFAIKRAEMVDDKQHLIALAQLHPYLTMDIIQASTHWTDLRIKLMLDYLIEEDRVRTDDSYRTGARYYFVSQSGT